MLWFRREERILAVGSVHLDTIALSNSPATHDDVTHVGDITHSVGGSAYNIAANLASHHAKAIGEAAIYCILPRHSVLTEIIKYKIDAAGINSKYVRLHRDFNGKHVRGGGYVGVLDDERLIRQAVVDAAMYEANIFQNDEESAALESAIAWADMIVLDADLAVSTVNHIADHARDNGKALFISVGSPTAGARSWVGSHDTNLATGVSGRLLVLCKVLERLEFTADEIAAFRRFVETGERSAQLDINKICRELKTRHVVCCNVQLSRGFAILAAGPIPYGCFFATPEDVRKRVQHGNSAGVMDGALAGFIHSYAYLVSKGSRDDASILNDSTRKLFNTNIVDFVEHVSQSEGATPGSVISFEEEAKQQSGFLKLWRLMKIAFDVLPVFRYVLSIVALIVALWLFEAAISVLEYFGYHVPFIDKVWVRTILRR